MQPVHSRQPIILEPREYAEYLTLTERPPTHLLRVLPDEEMKSQLVPEGYLRERESNLFDSL